MKLTTIRMSQKTWEAVQEEAEMLGVSATEFIREATIFRLGYRWAQRMDDDHIVERMRAIDRRAFNPDRF